MVFDPKQEKIIRASTELTRVLRPRKSKSLRLFSCLISDEFRHPKEREIYSKVFFKYKKEGYFLRIPTAASRAAPIAASMVALPTGDLVWIGAGVGQL